jgi:hypothetical protein
MKPIAYLIPNPPDWVGGETIIRRIDDSDGDTTIEVVQDGDNTICLPVTEARDAARAILALVGDE